VLFAGRLQIAPKAGIADQRLVALFELARERGHDRGAIGGILLRFRMVAADDVAPGGQHHRLGLVVGLLATLLHRQRHERRRIVEYQLAHQLVGTLAHPQDIKEAARLEFGQRLGADHAAVGDDAHAADIETPAQPVDDGDQARHVGGIARPHLRAHRPAVAVEQHGQDHLLQVRPVILAVAMLTQRLAAGVSARVAGVPMPLASFRRSRSTSSSTNRQAFCIASIRVPSL
jgi:hypothetical protein